jgi:uncharacterized protein DUF2735
MQHESVADGQTETMMNKNLDQGSATIYQFPVGGRASLGGRGIGETKPATELGTARVNEAVVSGSWYHEAAIEEAKLGREH